MITNDKKRKKQLKRYTAVGKDYLGDLKEAEELLEKTKNELIVSPS